MSDLTYAPLVDQASGQVVPGTVLRSDGATVPIGTGSAASRAYDAWIAAGNSLPEPAPPLRSTFVSALLDALSATQRGTITVDHMSRLVARAALGPVLITDPKVGRAATDMGITPDAWFKLART